MSSTIVTVKQSFRGSGERPDLARHTTPSHAYDRHDRSRLTDAEPLAEHVKKTSRDDPSPAFLMRCTERRRAKSASRRPEEGDNEADATTGRSANGDLMGDAAILKAMRTNEEDTVTAYERASGHDQAMAEPRAFFERAHSDELRHREWMQTTAEAL